METITRQDSNVNFIMKVNETSKKEIYQDLTIVAYLTNIRGDIKPSLKIWKGKQQNPYINFYFRDWEQRENKINEAKEMSDSRLKYKKQRDDENKSFVPSFEVGDIFASSWGYEQTQVDFYQVIEKNGVHTATLQKISYNTVEGSDGHDYCNVVAIKDSFVDSDTFKRRVTKNGIKICSVASASKWDGRPKYKSWYY